MARGKNPETIAEDLEEDLRKVRCICDIAANYAPNYDVEKMVQELTPDKYQMISAISS